MEWSRCLVRGLRIRIAVISRFRRLFPYRHRSSAGFGNFTAREFQSPLRLDQSIHVLDALAHVSVVLDPRLRVLPSYANAQRDVVAQSMPRHLHDTVWTLAQGDSAVSDLGLVSRSAPGAAPTDRVGRAKVRLESAGTSVESRLVDHNDGPDEPRMGLLPCQVTWTGETDAVGRSLAGNVRCTSSLRELVSVGSVSRAGLCDGSSGPRFDRASIGSNAQTRTSPGV